MGVKCFLIKNRTTMRYVRINSLSSNLNTDSIDTARYAFPPKLLLPQTLTFLNFGMGGHKTVDRYLNLHDILLGQTAIVKQNLIFGFQVIFKLNF